jgi:hypothetical protein
VSEAVAFDVYGVVMSADGEADLDATGRKRTALREARLRAARPARDVLPSAEGDPDLDAEWLGSAATTGTTSYGDVVLLDFEKNTASCVRCAQVLGKASDDFRFGCVVEVTGTSAAGPVRGQDYSQETVQIRHYYCPGCGTQVEAEVAALTGPYSGFRIAAPA